MTATETLWRDHHDRLAAFIRGRVLDQATADDILQDVFLRVHTALPSVKEGTKLQSWLYQIARNAVIDHYRSSKPHEPLPEWLAQPASAPSQAARRELTACLRPMMDQLLPPYKEAVTLADLENRPQQEIAQMQGLSLSGAKSRIQRGRAMVKELLAQCCQLEFDHRGTLVDYEAGDRPCSRC
jgi:RNA polymerase sigma-70 factor (ECF subfamily)